MSQPVQVAHWGAQQTTPRTHEPQHDGYATRTSSIGPARLRLRGAQRAAAEDRGATLLIAIISMLMMLAFGAFAVDLAAAWSQRSQNQGAVDTGGVAGALQTRGVGKTAAIAAADVEIIRITYATMSPDMTLTDWTAQWTACSDPGKGVEFTISATSDCISYTNSLSKVRVLLPKIPTDTTFAGIIGVDTLRTDAFAEIGSSLSAVGAVLPFGLPGNAANDPQICLKTGPEPQSIEPCDGPDTGNFSFIDITEFGNDDMGTSTQCTGATNTRMARNIARGIDHPLAIAPSEFAPFRTDLAGCQDGNFNYGPYSLTTETGNKVGVIDNGFIEGVGSYPGRLTLSTDTVTHGGRTWDDKPLWEYLNPAGQAFCAPYLTGPAWNHDDMATCVSNMAGSTPYFLEAIAGSARFGWVPLFYGIDLGLGNTTHNVLEFRSVYIQTTFWSCTPDSCAAIHDPSEPLQGSLAVNDKLEAVTAIQIPSGNLPFTIADGFGKGGEVVHAIIR